MPKEILSLIYLIALSSNSFAETKLEGKLEPFLGKPSLEIQPVFKGERFGNIVVTMDGTILATWGTSHVRKPDLGTRNRYCQDGFQPGGLTEMRQTAIFLLLLKSVIHLHRSQFIKVWMTVKHGRKLM